MYGRAEGGYAALAEEGNDLWGNDSIELIFAPGLKREEYYQIAFDYLGRQYSGYQKVAPIIQPVDLNWKAEGFRHAETLGKDRWTCEFFVPFSVFKCAAPKACDKWNFNFVRNKMSKPRDYSGSSLTMRKNTNLAMFGMLRFGGKDGL